MDRVNYGPSGHDDRPKGLVTENYYWREPVTYSPVKSIVKPKYPLFLPPCPSLFSYRPLTPFLLLILNFYLSTHHVLLDSSPTFVTDTICGGVHTFKMQEGKKSTDIVRAGRTEDCGRTWQPQLKRLRINHYWSKSVEDFNQKLLWDGYASSRISTLLTSLASY